MPLHSLGCTLGKESYGLHLDFRPSREEQWIEKVGGTARLVLGDQNLYVRWPGKLEMWIGSTQVF